jgi:ABC-type multidrug transport system fused ATPase/permease subunit
MRMITKRRNLERFLSYARPYRRRIALSTLVGVIKYNLPVSFPWILKEAIDGVLAGKPGRTGLGLNQLMGLAVLIFAVYAVISYLRTSFFHLWCDMRKSISKMWFSVIAPISPFSTDFLSKSRPAGGSLWSGRAAQGNRP